MNKTTDDKQPGFSELIKKAQEMQKKLQDMQKQMMETEITGQAGGGLVKITMTGHHYARRVVLDSSVMKEDKSFLEDLIASAINDTADKIERHMRDKVSGLAGIKLPDNLTDGDTK
ncbi:MAG TPA: YbaB/EbfC family nucleoid-associated protein [Gammaproteobacteria bacterium]|nr:YbaB/EbfC family nucleoid-associated protein [Gammaproteobacteria bacterium]